MTAAKIEMDHFVDSVIRESKAAFLDFIDSLADDEYPELGNSQLLALVDTILSTEIPCQESLKQLALQLPKSTHLYSDAIKLKKNCEESVQRGMLMDE
jgi:hypothetical protein